LVFPAPQKSSQRHVLSSICAAWKKKRS
jgi:hypothetical protein